MSVMGLTKKGNIKVIAQTFLFVAFNLQIHLLFYNTHTHTSLESIFYLDIESQFSIISFFFNEKSPFFHLRIE